MISNTADMLTQVAEAIGTHADDRDALRTELAALGATVTGFNRFEASRALRVLDLGKAEVQTFARAIPS